MSDSVVVNVISPQNTSINVTDTGENVYVNYLNGLINHAATHYSGAGDELSHNLLGSLQGGSPSGYYHLTSGEYTNLVTGTVIRPSDTGVFYPRTNPSGFITGVNLSGYVTGDVVRPSETGNFITTSQTGAFYASNNPSGFITGVDLSFSGDYYTKSESESRYVNTTGTETILGDKTFHDKVYINNLYVTGLETIVNTTNFNVESNYLLLNLTGGAVDGGLFFVTGSGLTGINDSGAIIGFDHSDKFKFGIGTRASDLSVLDTIASFEDVTGISGGLQTQISILNNQTGNYVLNTQTGNFITTGQTGQFYSSSNPSGYITGVDLSSYATINYTTGISGGLQTQITNLSNATGSYVLTSQTGVFYPTSNPSGFVTGSVIRPSDTGVFYPTSNPSGFITPSQTGAFYPTSNPSGFVTGSVIRPSDTGAFYPASNPSGFITGFTGGSGTNIEPNDSQFIISASLFI